MALGSVAYICEHVDVAMMDTLSDLSDQSSASIPFNPAIDSDYYCLHSLLMAAPLDAK